jgi:hypothetical protein
VHRRSAGGNLAHDTRPAFLIQLLLPTRDNGKQPISETLFLEVRRTLTERFGGVTAYQRAPAAGAWKRADGSVDGDEVVMVEVEADTLDRTWWSQFQQRLERDFRQEQILMRAIRIETF